MATSCQQFFDNCFEDLILMDAITKAKLTQQARQLIADGQSVKVACMTCGISPANYKRWVGELDEHGIHGLEDKPRSGRPSSVNLTEEEKMYLAKTYLKSNKSRSQGSVTLSARYAAKDPTSPLSQATRDAILAERSSKHSLPAAIVRATRQPEHVVARYRDKKHGQNNGIYAPNTSRRNSATGLLLQPGERQVWDDASVNVGVVVPWDRTAADPCAQKHGCRVARFQLLLGIDCATDMCVGYHYVMRNSDGYGAADIVSAFNRTWSLAGGAPKQVVVEGGSWQTQRVKDYLDATGVEMISAKGRPNQKLVEAYFNRLWTAMSVALPTGGQVGRFRGEMAAENREWMRARQGIVDPRTIFPSLEEFLTALDAAINFLNTERIESRTYGTWVPAEAYGKPALLGLPRDIRSFAAPVREVRKVRRQGMVQVAALSALGYSHQFSFVIEGGYAYDGAEVNVAFDPMDIDAGAMVTLAKPWRGEAAGKILDEAAVCISPAPQIKLISGQYAITTDNRITLAKDAKRKSMATVASQTAAFDDRGVKARKGTTGKRTGTGIRIMDTNPRPEAPALVPDAPAINTKIDFSSEEEALGIFCS